MTINKIRILFSFAQLVILFVLLVLPLCAFGASIEQERKKIVWVDSYHQGYDWSDGIERGIHHVFSERQIELHTFRMDTKRFDSVEFGREAGRKANAFIQEIKPNLVIATDDNAQKYLVVPFLKDTELPVVFSGVNWDAEEYGYPCSNVTGMVEVDLVNELVAQMKRNAGGDRVGFLTVDVETGRKMHKILSERFFNNRLNSYLVSTYQEFQDSFLLAQKENDMLIIYNNINIENWDSFAAEKFVFQHTSIPTGALLEYMDQFTMYTLAKLSREQGEYAAATALKVLGGTPIDSIPLTANKQSKLTVNLKMAKAAGITFPLSILKTAEVIGEEVYQQSMEDELSEVKGSSYGKKVVWVDSYSTELEWSREIEFGIKEVFADLGIELKIIRLNSKKKKKPEEIKASARKAYSKISSFKPDAIIASDDNVQKYLIVPFFKDTELPVVFCGVNYDASMYGYPTSNITGMIELDPLYRMLKLLKKYSAGDRVIFLAPNTTTERKIAAFYTKYYPEMDLSFWFVKDVEEYRQKFIEAQDAGDMLILRNPAGIHDWNSEEMVDFISEYNRLPTGSFTKDMERYAMFCLAKSGKEQGQFAAQAVLEIFKGEAPQELPVAHNQLFETRINLGMADKAGFVIPVSILKDADMVIGQEGLDRD